MEIYLFGLLSLGSIFYFFRLARNAERPAGPRVDFLRYGSADAIFASLLAAFFVYSAYLSLVSPPIKITSVVLVNNAVFSFILVFGVLLFISLRLLHPVTLFGLKRLTLRGAGLALVSLIAAIPAIYFAYSLSMYFSGPDAAPQPLVQFFSSAKSTPLDRALLIFTAVVVAPVGEELIFRGYIYGVARRFAGRWSAAIFSALLFSAIHAHIPALAPLAVLALALTFVYESTGSLWAPMLMHATFNAITLILSLAWPNLAS